MPVQHCTGILFAVTAHEELYAWLFALLLEIVLFRRRGDMNWRSRKPSRLWPMAAPGIALAMNNATVARRIAGDEHTLQ